MSFENIIECIGRDNLETTFRYSLEESELNQYKKWIFRIVPENLEFQDWFEFSVLELSEIDRIGKVITMNANRRSEYLSKGIPDKMIEVSSQVLGLNIISSTNKEEYKFTENEFRTEEASKVWDRLVKKGCASYDLENDVYKYERDRD